MQFLIGFLIFVAVIYGVMVGSAMIKLRNLRWTQRTYYTPAQASDVPAMTVRLLQETTESLQALGFESGSWYQVHEPYSQNEQASFVRGLYHQGTRSHAQVSLHPLPESGHSVTVEFLNVAQDGNNCYTTNGTWHLVGMTIPGYDWEDPDSPTLAEHWAYHRQRLDQQMCDWRELSVAELADWGNRFLEQYRQALLSQGDLKAISDTCYRFTLGGCWRALRRSQKRQQPRPEPTPAAELSTDAEVLAHLRQEAILGKPARSTAGKTLLLAGSVILFMVSFGYRMDVDSLFILLAVLLFHELGHIAAMALFGYRDLQILFIPFLGAVATGRKQQVRPWQSAVIYLAGPVPGLILALVLWQMGLANATDWMPVLIAMLFFINFFNLLPIQPLDGGQLANVLLFQRWPRLQGVFHGLSVLMFLALAWALDTPLLAGIGFLLGFGLLYQYREARVLSHLRQTSATLNTAARANQMEAIYQAIRDLKLPWNFCTRQQATRNILQRLGNPLPRLWETTAGLAFYLLILLATPATLMAWDYYPIYALLDRAGYQEPDWEAQLASAEDPQERLEILTHAAYDQFYNEQADEALAYNRQAMALLNEQGLQDTLEMAAVLSLRARIRLEYGDVSAPKVAKQVHNDLDEVIRIYQLQIQGPDTAYFLAEAHELKAAVDERRGEQEAALQHWQRSADYRRQYPGEQGWFLADNFQAQAKLYLALNDLPQAEHQYLESLRWANRADDIYTLDQALTALVGFYLDQQQYQQALDSIEANPYPDEEGYDYYRAHLYEMAGWAHFKLSQPAEAARRFEAAIELINQRNAQYQSPSRGYDKADNISRLLLLQHSGTSLARLLQELDSIDRSVADYKRHLECECNRHAGGYRLEQSEQLRDLIDQYLPDTVQSL